MEDKSYIVVTSVNFLKTENSVKICLTRASREP